MPTIIEPDRSIADDLARALAATPGDTVLLSGVGQAKAHLEASATSTRWCSDRASHCRPG